MSSHSVISIDPSITPLSPHVVSDAHARIAGHINRTPVMKSALLDEWLGHDICFKMECFQKSGAYKIRGAFNALLSLKEEGRLPREVVAYSSGNHAQAVAKAAKLLGVHATIIMPSFVSTVKQQATRSYGATLILTDTRQETEVMALQKQREGLWLLHPSADDAVIAGQGTACLEALEDSGDVDAVFAPCGGGGLLSGTWLATQLLSSSARVYGVEPLMANDTAQSLRSGEIITLPQTPMTIADGARTLHISERTFYYLKQLAGFYEIPEEPIIYWTQWLSHLLKVSVEPTSAMAMAGTFEWLKTQNKKQRVLVILSGGNLDAQTQRSIWQTDYLGQLPHL
jgi:threo-3-hydroxy-L-aspartate ammonia-lyase